MAYMIEDKLRDAAKEKALKEVVEATVKDKDKAVKNAEERIRAAESARALAEQRVGGLEVKLRGTELKLAEAKSLNSASAKEIAELKAALEASEDKWYNTSFADVENSIELIIYQSRRYGFDEGWMAALQVIGVLDDSLLRNLDQIPYLDPILSVQNPTGAEEEDTPSMRELVQEIDFHLELIDLEITNNPNAVHNLAQPHVLDFTSQLVVDTTSI